MLRLSSIWRHSRPFSLLASGRGPSSFCGRKSTRGTHQVAVEPGRTTAYIPQPHINIDHKMPPTTDGPSETFGNFDLLQRVKLDYTDVVISRWQSRVTGLNIAHVDFDGPIVDGYFVLGTEIFDDSGCPHTLEHLVFMGSEKYPYKGIIDLLANRGFSNGTNAWTDTDHTAYTVSTAGGQGFLQLLPIYVDHILYPTMTQSAFVTEVHHINSKGEDSGVVYSEMQGRENTAMDLITFRMQRLLNPPGSAYRSETGGLMEALRVLAVDQIRQYHRTYYVPHNLSLVVSGKLVGGTSSLLKVAEEQIEPSIIAHGQNHGPRPQGWKRPFLETDSAKRGPIPKTIKETVEFPEKDESMGELVMTFMGPPAHNFLERKALDVLGTYLTSSPVAPLNREFVEIESPLCGYIYFNDDTRATLCDLTVYIGSVPTPHLDTFDIKLKASLQRIIKEGIDMERMSMIINRDERQLRSRLESSKSDVFSISMIADFLYGASNGSDIVPSIDEFNRYTTLKTWSSKQWTDLLQKYFVDPECIVLRGKPSANMAEKLETSEKARIAAQVKKLGPEGLAKVTKELEDAKAEHDKPIPKEVLTAFPVPDVKSISWIPVQSVQERGTGRTPPTHVADSELKRHIESDGSPLTFFVEYEYVKSDFVSVHAMFSLAKVPNHLRPYVTVYVASFFSLPVKRESGERLTHEEVINKLDSETVSYEPSFGVDGQFCEMLRVSFKVETAHYETAIAWLKDLLCGSEFNKERLQVNVAKLQQSLPEMKRDGNTVLSSVWANLLYAENSTSRAGGILPQTKFIPMLIQDLQHNPDKVIADFNKLREYLLDPSGIRIGVTGDILKIKNPRSVWDKHFGKRLIEAPLASVPFASETLNKLGKQPMKKAIVLSLPTIESTFVNHTTQGIQGFANPESPALIVALECLNATEGYLWRSIRGSGLAYGASVSADRETGLLTFSLYRSSDSLQAYKEAEKVVKGLVDGSVVLDATTLDAAKSSIVYSVTRGVSTAGRAAIASLVNQALKGVSQNWNVELLKKYQAVTKEDVLAALKKHVLPIFDPSSSVVVAVTAPSKAESIGTGLADAGFEIEMRTLEIDPSELEEGSEDGSDSESESDSDRDER